MSSSFMIAAYEDGVVGLTSLDELTTAVTPDPQFSYFPYAEYVKLGDCSLRGVGPSAAEWLFPFLLLAQRDQLAAFCTAASAQVYIRTPKGDGTFANFLAIMSLPEEEPPIKGGELRNYVVRFDALEEQEEA